jgi:phage baseplate assembly protein W
MTTTTTEKTYSTGFKDLDLSLQIHPVKKDVNTHKNEYAIINSIKNLILTNHYEKFFHPEIGSNIRRLLFENVDTVIAAQIEKEIEDTVSNFEPRVEISKVTATPSPDQNRYNVQMEFFITNVSNQIKINFFLERIR